jgi:hypothetical protein
MRISIIRRGRVVSGLAAVGLAVVVSGGSALSAQAPAPSTSAPATKGAKPSAPAPATTPTAALPSARSIIDRHIAAVGGRKAILAHTSSHATGTMTVAGSGITGVLDVYGAKPDKSLMKINLGGIGDVFEGFNGTHAWSVSPITGPMLTQGKELAEKKFDTDFYSELHEDARYASMKTVEKTTFEGRPCYKVSLIRKDGGEDIELYDVETGLKAGAIVTRESQMGPMTLTQVYSDYKKFGGMLLASTMKQTAMGVEQVFKITSVEFDNVSPSTFDLPAPIKALIK